MSLNSEQIRARFPALSVQDDGRARLYLDNPAGTQIVDEAVARMSRYLVESNANCGGVFRTSMMTDQLLEESHQAMADFLNANSPEEIVFGANMTSLTFTLSRVLGSCLDEGDEVIVTRLDHDANVRPWIRMAEDCGAVVRWLDFDPDNCRLRLEMLDKLLTERTRLVAVGLASNVVGTINPVSEIAERVRGTGAHLFIDAVHFAPHGAIDVQALGADFLVCSPYKFFGPHSGVLWGRRELLAELPAYRVEPAGNALPGRFETGTQSHEAQAGVLGVMEYLSWLGGMASHRSSSGEGDRRDLIRAGMDWIRRYEQELSVALIQGLETIERVNILGITSPDEMATRVPTVSFTVDGKSPRWIAERLAARNIYTWDGDSYAYELVKRLGLESQGGVLRVGAVHYNTVDEIRSFVATLSKILKED